MVKLTRTSTLSLRRNSPEQHLLRSSINSVESTGSTFTVPQTCAGSSSSGSSISASYQEEDATTTTTTSKRVCFSEDLNQVYQCQQQQAQPHQVYHEDDVTWYTAQELSIFKAEAMCIARAIVDANEQANRSDSWPRLLLVAYQKFGRESSVVAAAMDKVPLPPIKATSSLVGLDRWVLPAMARDKVKRRQWLFQEMQHLQETIVDPTERASLVARASRVASQPARLYAIHVATWWDQN